MIDINYGNYTLFQYLIIAFTLFPIEIIHSWLIVMIYLVMANYKFNPNKPGIFQWQSVDDVFLMVVD
ncbi:hypothetical protein EFS16_14415 [Levilactobacillus brevis]|uniref:hypothetical protein n=1 Tax=Levilactobacillus brevis TaxID=1580 RepID=UPI0021A657B8|nr:hypothetical protein [Levilactobacillus brevis]MCT3579988.1 hypothetical protein [Levilactobacillus brevis]